MSVPSSTTWVQFVLSTNPQTLTVPFVFSSAADLLVLDTKPGAAPTVLTLNSDYSVSGGGGSTGTISTKSGGASAVAVGDTITIARAVPLTQLLNLVSGGPFTPAIVGAALDKLTEIAQQLNLYVARALQYPMDENRSGVMPLNDRKNAFVAFDGSGALTFLPAPSIIGTVTNPLSAVSVSALKLVTVADLPDGTPCEVAGYYTPNDGGGGIYFWNATSTATPDDGTIVESNLTATGRWILRTNGTISVRQLGCKGDGSTDDSIPFQKALDLAGTILVPPGTYVVQELQIAAHTKLLGTRDGSVLKGTASGSYIIAINPGDEGSPDPADNTFGVELHGLTIQGRSEGGSSPGRHNMIVSAASHVVIDNCAFTAFQWDGLYLGCYVAATERHNEDVSITRCLFDGVNKENRNGITVIDATGLVIRDCEFTRCTDTANGPAAIDIEPDPAAYIRLRDIYIEDNKFTDVGVAGDGAAAIGVFLLGNTQASLTTPVQNIQIRGNSFDLIDNCIAVLQEWAAGATPINVAIDSNHIAPNPAILGASALSFGGIRGLSVTNNRLAFSSNPVVFSNTCQDVYYGGNQHLGGHAQAAIQADSISNAVFFGNNIQATDWAFSFTTGNTSANVAIINNLVPSGATYLVQGAGHTFGTDNRISGNIGAQDLINDAVPFGGPFQRIETTWDPGSLDAEGATYTLVTGFVNLDPGKHVACAQLPLQNDKWVISANILGSDTVAVCIVNKTGGTVDLPEQAVVVSILPNC